MVQILDFGNTLTSPREISKIPACGNSPEVLFVLDSEQAVVVSKRLQVNHCAVSNESLG
jgi:hypothetical protein